MTVPSHDVKEPTTKEQPDPTTSDTAEAPAPVDVSPFAAGTALEKVNVYSFTVYRKSQIAAGNQMGERVNAVGTDLAAVEALLKDNLDPEDVTKVTGGVVQIEGAYMAGATPPAPPGGGTESTASHGRTVTGSTHSGISAGTSKAAPPKKS